MTHEEINMALQRALARTLGDYNLLGDSTEPLQKSFINGFYTVLKQSFNINIDIEKLEFFSNSNKATSDEEMAKFIANTVEDESTYILLNYYILKFLEKLAKNEEYHARVTSELDKQLEGRYAEVVIDSYNRYTTND